MENYLAITVWESWLSLSGSFPLDWDSLGISQVFGANGHGQVQVQGHGHGHASVQVHVLHAQGHLSRVGMTGQLKR